LRKSKTGTFEQFEPINGGDVYFCPGKFLSKTSLANQRGRPGTSHDSYCNEKQKHLTLRELQKLYRGKLYRILIVSYLLLKVNDVPFQRTVLIREPLSRSMAVFDGRDKTVPSKIDAPRAREKRDKRASEMEKIKISQQCDVIFKDSMALRAHETL
jgi:hypothetical protein